MGCEAAVVVEGAPWAGALPGICEVPPFKHASANNSKRVHVRRPSPHTSHTYTHPLSSQPQVLLLGPQGVEEELAEAGLPYVTAASLRLPRYDSPDAMLAMEVGGGVGVFVCVRGGGRWYRARYRSSQV